MISEDNYIDILNVLGRPWTPRGSVNARRWVTQSRESLFNHFPFIFRHYFCSSANINGLQDTRRKRVDIHREDSTTTTMRQRGMILEKDTYKCQTLETRFPFQRSSLRSITPLARPVDTSSSTYPKYLSGFHLKPKAILVKLTPHHVCMMCTFVLRNNHRYR